MGISTVNLGSMIRRSAHKRPKKVALVSHEGVERTYSELELLSNRFARGLTKLGIKKGEHIAGFKCPKSVDFVEALPKSPVFTAPIVISNADIKASVLELTGQEHFPSGYVDKIENLSYAYHGIGLKVALKEKVTDDQLLMYMPYDFVDHYRGEFAKFDRQWEDRWIRDLGFDQLVPEAVKGLLDKYRQEISDFSKVVYPCHYPAARKKLNKLMGISPELVQKNLQAEIGETGTPHSLVMLISALEEAKPGDKILVVSFGSGCDALYFEVTKEIENPVVRNGISGCL